MIIFVTANTQTVTVNYFWGKPIFGFKHPTREEVQTAKREGKSIPEPYEPRQIPVMLIVFAAFLLGIIATSTFGTIERVKFKSKIKKEKRALKIENQKLAEEEKAKEKEMVKKIDEVKSANTQPQIQAPPTKEDK